MEKLTKEQIKILEDFENDEDENEDIRDVAYETLKDGDWPLFESFMKRQGYWGGVKIINPS